MSRPMPERLRQLETEVRDLEVLPAADIRARGRRRRHRQLAAVSVAAAVVATTAGVAATRTLGSPDQPTAAPGLVAAQPSSAAPGLQCNLTLPDSAEKVRIRVRDGGAPAGAAAAIATQLRERRYVVVRDAGGPTDPATGPARVSYGPAAIGAATLVKAVILGESTMRFDPDRTDDTIDLTLGSAFERLTTPTELNQALVELDEPTAPPQCAPAPSPSPSR
jgi:hypothetical protein